MHTWIISHSGAESTCSISRTGTEINPTCGPNNRFRVRISEDGLTSTLSVQVVDSDVNRTTCMCDDGNMDEKSFCVIGQHLITCIILSLLLYLSFVCVWVCVCVCLSVTTLVATLFVSTHKARYVCVAFI